MKHQIFTAEEKKKIGLASGMCLLSNLLQMIPVILIVWVLQTLIDGKVSIASMCYLSGAGIICVFVLYLAQTIQYRMTYVPSYTIAAQLRERLANKIRDLPMSYFDPRNNSNLTSVFIDDVGALENALAMILPHMFGALGAIVIALFVLSMYSLELTLAAALFLPVSILILGVSKAIQDRKLNKMIKNKRMAYAKEQEFLETVKELKIYGFCASYIDEIEDQLQEVTKIEVQTETAVGGWLSSAMIFLKFGIAAVILVGAIRISDSMIDMMTYFVFLIMIARLYDPIAVFFLQIAQIFAVKSQVKKIQQLQDEPVPKGIKVFQPQTFDLEFKDVTFSYGEKLVFKQLSFVAKEGKITALTGKSGSGKSTAAKLAARFDDPQEGSVTLAGIDIAHVAPDALMPYYAFVFQDVLLFDDTVMENIRLGRPEASDAEVLEVARLMMCDEFVLQLPNGYNTRIGENGSRLSGGERQRISIARAMLKRAPIILLDESTAGLDAENEYAVQTAISALVQGKTVIVIAHRKRTIEHADQIVVIESC